MAAVDLDGTLLHSDHQVADSTREYLQKLDQKGFKIAIATGRAANTVFEHVVKLNFPHPLPVVCSNGARGLMCSVVNDDETSQVQVESTELFSTPVPLPVVEQTIRLAQEMGFVTQYYAGDEIYADPSLPHHFDLTKQYMELTGSKTIYVESGDFTRVIEEQGLPSKMLVLCRVEDQDRMIERFESVLRQPENRVVGDKPAHTIRGNLGFFMEILHPNVCKGHGLERMCQHLQTPMDECIAFGDGDNDYEFIRMAGRGIVMKNGRDVVKGVADEVLDLTNDEVSNVMREPSAVVSVDTTHQSNVS